MNAITKTFVLAGDAIFTIELPGELAAKHAPHYTFRVQHVEKNDRYPESYFVKMLTGPDNTSDYSYIGKLDPHTSEVRTTAKSFLPQNAFPVALLNRLLARIWTDDHDAYMRHGFKTHHEGRCCRCGRPLTTPESCERGIGPECYKIMGLREPAEESFEISDYPNFDTSGLTAHRNTDGDLTHWTGTRNGKALTVFND